MIRLEVQRLPSGAIPKPVWLRHSRTGLDHVEVDLAWQAFLPLTARTQLRLARDLTADLRRPRGNPDQRTGSLQRGSAEGFGTCTHISLTARPRPSRRNTQQRPTSRHDVHTVTSTHTRKTKHGNNTKTSNPRPRRTG